MKCEELSKDSAAIASPMVDYSLRPIAKTKAPFLQFSLTRVVNMIVIVNIANECKDGFD